MPSNPEMSEPSDLEISKTLRKAFIAKQRKRAILTFVIGLLAVVAFLIAWDRGIIFSIWNVLCRVVADWRTFLQ